MGLIDWLTPDIPKIDVPTLDDIVTNVWSAFFNDLGTFDWAMKGYKTPHEFLWHYPRYFMGTLDGDIFDISKLWNKLTDVNDTFTVNIKSLIPYGDISSILSKVTDLPSLEGITTGLTGTITDTINTATEGLASSVWDLVDGGIQGYLLTPDGLGFLLNGLPLQIQRQGEQWQGASAIFGQGFGIGMGAAGQSISNEFGKAYAPNVKNPILEAYGPFLDLVEKVKTERGGDSDYMDVDPTGAKLKDPKKVLSDIPWPELNTSEMMRQLIGVPGKFLMSSVMSLINYDGYGNYDEAKKSAEAYVGLNLGFGISAWTAGVAAELMYPTKHLNLDRLVQSINWSMGLGWLSWIILGEPFRVAIAEPLRTHYMERYRTYVLSLGEAWSVYEARTYGATLDKSSVGSMYNSMKAAEERHEAFVVEKMGLNGYHPNDIPSVIDSRKKQFSLSQIRKLYDKGIFSEVDAMYHIWKQGYSRFQASYLLQLYNVDEVEEEEKLTKAQLIEMEALGIITTGVRDEGLKALGYNDRQIMLFDDLAEAKAKVDQTKIIVSTLTEKYRKNEVTAVMLRTDLTALGLSNTKIENIIETTNTVKAIQDKRASETLYKQAYRYGIITLQELMEYLLSIGYANTDASLILLVEAKRLPKPKEPIVRKPNLALFKRAFKEGVITEARLRQAMSALGISAEEIDIQVTLLLREIAVPRPDEVPLPIGEAPIPAEALALALQPEVRKVPIASYYRAFEWGIITEAELRNALMAEQYTDTQIDFFMEIETARVERLAEVIPAFQIERAFRAGIITEDTFKDMLLGAGLPEDDADRIVLRNKYLLAPPTETLTKSEVLRVYKQKLIDESEAFDRLQAMGLDPWDVHILLETVVREVA